MIGLLGVLAPIALLNSVLILPSGITGVAASLGTPKPFLTASAFIAGKFVPYFIFGLLLAIGLDTAFDQLKIRALDAWQDPTTLLIALQLIIGSVMVGFAYFMSHASQRHPGIRSAKLVSPAGAFSVAAAMTLMSLPGALLYFAAIDQVLRADLSAAGVVKAVLFYNLIFVLPLMVLVLLRGLLGARCDPVFAAVTRFFERWGKEIILFGMLSVGAVLVVDAIGWLVGFPLLPSQLR